MSKRADAVGLFWEDLAPEKKPKVEKIKRGPPKRVWDDPAYLPGLFEAREMRGVVWLSDYDLWMMQGKQLILDIECYPNYFLAAFRCPSTMRCIAFELSYDTNYVMDYAKLEWVLHNFEIITFNGNHYDVPITTLALAGKTPEFLYWATEEIIVRETRPSDILRANKIKKLRINHVDIMEVCPLQASLKLYAGRLHVQRMQDLPFKPGTQLSRDQAAIVRWYCIGSDIPATALIYNELKEQMDLRYVLSDEYGVDVRSKSDAQIAEAVIAEEIQRITGVRPKAPTIEPGTSYRYTVPPFIKYESALMNWALDVVRNTDFVVSEFGNIGLPESLTGMKLNIGYATYRMGNGGLHSSEKKVMHIANSGVRILDRDVESFYPRIILNQRLYPAHLGPVFLQVYDAIVQRRIHAKKMQAQCKEAGDKVGAAKWKVVQESLKITINGSFGKLGSMYSILYAPHLVIQVTLTGQLSLLMLIERMEMAGIPVVSANTDGIVMRVETHMQATYEAIIKQWEKDTDYKTEETEYLLLGSRDVNNYIAIKKKDVETKNKGVFANPWNIPNNIWRFHKNPQNIICTEAIENWLTKHVPIDRTIRECRDITKFCTVRNVKGGAVKLDANDEPLQYLGKSVRWYYATDSAGDIVYANSGNKVSRSDGAKPCMDLPAAFPEDVDMDWYVNEAFDMLRSVGYA